DLSGDDTGGRATVNAKLDHWSEQIAVLPARIARLDRHRYRPRPRSNRSWRDVDRERCRSLTFDRAQHRREERPVPSPLHPVRGPAILDVGRNPGGAPEPHRPERQQRIVVLRRDELERRVLEYGRGAAAQGRYVREVQPFEKSRHLDDRLDRLLVE